MNADELEALAQNILEGFSWEDSPQGEDYWDTVHNNLLDMADAARSEGN